MARHPTARRVHKPQTTPDDVFVEGVLETTVWAREHRNLIIGIATALVIVVGGFFWVRNYRQTLNDRAAIEILQVRQNAQGGNPALAIRDAEAFLERFGNTTMAPEARLILAQAYLESGQPQQVAQALDGLDGSVGTTSGVAAASLVAAAHEAATRYEEAEGVLLRIADNARFDYQKVAALDNAARIRTERGNAAGAVALYDRILALLPADSQDRPIYEMRRAEAAAATSAAS